jgi:hypothetical protein
MILEPLLDRVRVINASNGVIREVSVKVAVSNGAQDSRASTPTLLAGSQLEVGRSDFEPAIAGDIAKDTVQISFVDPSGNKWQKIYVGSPELIGHDKGWLFHPIQVCLNG